MSSAETDRSPPRVLLATFGSTGDIFPFVRLGVALKAAGCDVRFAAQEYFRPSVEAAGLECFGLLAHWNETRLREAMQLLVAKRRTGKLLKAIYSFGREEWQHIVEAWESAVDDRDWVIGTYLFPSLRAVSEQKGARFVTLALAPHGVPSPDYPPFNPAARRTLPKPLWRSLNALGWRLAEKKVTRTAQRALSRQPGIHRDYMQRFLPPPGEPVLVAMSPLWRNGSGPLPEGQRYVGFLRWQSPEDPEIEERLRAYTGGEGVPVLSFGSVGPKRPDKILSELEIHWPQGAPLIVQNGWAGLADRLRRSEFFPVGPMSHDQLFRHASVVIHHGGAGTTASAVCSGRPQIVIPHMGDQYFWAQQVTRRGLGKRLHRERWPAQLYETVQALQTPNYQTRAAHWGERIRQEDPTAAAMEALIGWGMPLDPACCFEKSRSETA